MLFTEGMPSSLNGPAVAGYLWLGLVGGLITYTLWFSGIGRLPVTAVALLGLLSPIVAATLGALVLGQELSAMQRLGFLLALTAIVAGQLTRQPRTPQTAVHATLRESHEKRTTSEGAFA